MNLQLLVEEGSLRETLHLRTQQAQRNTKQ